MTGAPLTLAPRVTRRAMSPWIMTLPLGIALAFLPPLTTGALAIGAAGATVLMLRPTWALYLLAFTVPYQSHFDVRVYDVSVSITEGVVAVLLIGWLSQLMVRRARPPAPAALTAAVAALLVCFALTVVVATNLTMAAKEMLKWTELAAVYLAGTSLLETPRQRRVLLFCLLGAGVSQALVGLTQSVLRLGPGHFLIGGVIMRAYGSFEQPNPFGGYIGLSVPLAVSIAAFGLPVGRWRRAATAAAVLTGGALLITLSRGAWVAQVTALSIVLSMSSVRARRTLAAGILGSAVVLATLWPLLPAELTERAASVVSSAFDLGSVRNAVVTPENWAVLERLSQWYAGVQMFLDRPFLGVGIGNYNAAYDDYRLEQWPVALGHAHNHYLTVAAEAGLLGLLAYLLFWGIAFRGAVRAVRAAPGPFERAVAVGILGSLAAFATHNLFDVLFVHGMGVTLGLLMTLLHSVPFGLTSTTTATKSTSSVNLTFVTPPRP